MSNKNAPKHLNLVFIKTLVLIYSFQLVARENLHNEFKDKIPERTVDRVKFHLREFVIFSLIENSAEKVTQRPKNKTNHMKYGNKSNKKPQKYIKILTWNKANSDILTHIDVIKHHIQEENPTVAVLQESNVKPEDDLASFFPEYEVENKFERNHKKARLTILIKKNTVIYERVKNLEKENICNIWLKIRFNRSKWLYLCGAYRQWRLPSETGMYTSGCSQEQVAGLHKIIEQVRDAGKLSKHLLVAGDLNIDMSVDKDTVTGDDLKHLIPIYEEFLNKDGLAIMNTEKTRFQSNQDPSFVDHLVSNVPQNFDNIQTKKALISDH